MKQIMTISIFLICSIFGGFSKGLTDTVLCLELASFPKNINYARDLRISPVLSYKGKGNVSVPKILKFGYETDKTANAYFLIEKCDKKSTKKNFPIADYQYSSLCEIERINLEHNGLINYNRFNLLRFYILNKGSYRIKLFIKVSSVKNISTKWYYFKLTQNFSIKNLIETDNADGEI